MSRSKHPSEKPDSEEAGLTRESADGEEEYASGLGPAVWFLLAFIVVLVFGALAH